MNFEYLLIANLLLSVVVLYYRLLLSRQRRFQLNRIFLLAGSGLAFLLPLLHVNTSPDTWAAALAPVGKVVRTLPEVIIGAGTGTPGNETASLGWTGWAEKAYLLVAGIMAALLAYRLGRLLWTILSSPKERDHGYTKVHSATAAGPASFFRFLFWDDSLEESSPGAAVVLAHERCHIRQWHSLDTLAMELLAVVCWFNPAVYLLRRDLRRCHEFLADEAAARVGGKEALFRQVLARQFGMQNIALANHFQSQIKARITMLNLKSGHKALVRYLMILPLVGLMFACTSLEKEEPLPAETVSTSTPAPIQPKVEGPADETAPTESVEVLSLDSGAAPVSSNSTRVGSDPGVNDFVELDQEPSPTNMAEVAGKIAYPKAAKEAEITGKVIVRVKVGKDGSVEEHTVIKDPHPLLTQEVEKHLYELKFTPGIKDGKKVKAWVTIPFKFEL